MSEYRLPPETAPKGPAGEEFVYPGVDEDENPTAIVWHYLRVLRRHCWKILGFVLAVVAVTLLYSLQLTPLYEAQALIELESLNRMTRLGSDMVSYNVRNESKVIETQLRLIDSPEIVEAVTADLGLGRSPLFGYPGQGEPVVPTSLPGLTASMLPNTYLLSITYRSTSPELCRDISNSVAKAYIERGYKTRYQEGRRLQNWLDLQLEELQARSERAQQALLAYERKHNIARSEGRPDLVGEELHQLQNELLTTQAERIRKETAYHSIEAGELEALLFYSGNSPMAVVIRQRAELEGQLFELSTHYGPNHPRYKAQQARIDRLDSLLEKARQTQLEILEAEYREVVLREEAVRERYLKKKAQTDLRSELAVEYGSLSREANATTALYEQLLGTVNQVGLQSSLSETQVRMAEPAGLPTKAVYPDVPRYLLWAFLASSALGIGAAVLADYLDRTVRDTAQVEQWLRVPVLANLPRLAGNKKPQTYLLPAGTETNAPRLQGGHEAHAIIEGFSMLRTSLLLSPEAADWRLLLVSSAVPAEGKSTVSCGLAAAIAQQSPEQRVLLVDADLRRPTIHTNFGLPNQVGLSSLLEARSTLDDAVCQVEALPSLYVLPRGPGVRRPNDLLAANMGPVFDELREKFDYVIVDSAPLLASADSMVLATLVDGVVLVARAGETSRDMVAAGFRQVRRVRANVIGLVLNQVRQGDQPGYHSYYYYNYYRRDEDEA